MFSLCSLQLALRVEQRHLHRKCHISHSTPMEYSRMEQTISTEEIKLHRMIAKSDDREIPPEERFEYSFNVGEQTGTYWIHTHIKGQYPNGLRAHLSSSILLHHISVTSNSFSRCQIGLPFPYSYLTIVQ